MSDDIDIMARTIFGEARGEGYDGMVAVACVIMNRVALALSHPHFGDGTVAGACLVPWQFSCWNENDPNLPKLRAATKDDPIFVECVNIAEAHINGATDITNNATYYYDRRSPEPDWAQGKTPCFTLGHHRFFNNIT